MTITLYVVAIVALLYLIYRYVRYNDWNSTPIGRAFVASKTAMLAICIYSLTVAVLPDWEFRDPVRLVLVGYALVSIFYQLQVVIRFQGGFRRRSHHGSGASNNES